MYLVYRFKKIIRFLLIGWWQQVIRAIQFMLEFFRIRALQHQEGRFRMSIKDLHPYLKDRTSQTPLDFHYTYHPAWAARILAQTKPEKHIDISSITSFSTISSAFIPIEFYDYRPAPIQLSNFHSGKADLLDLPFESNHIKSLSCMHTVEHVGLGRYGDPIDVKGDLKAINELKRVVAPLGNLIFVTPTGTPKIYFNAHRVYSFDQIMSYFDGFELIEFSLVTDDGDFIHQATAAQANQQVYGCGCYWFKKKESHVSNRNPE